MTGIVQFFTLPTNEREWAVFFRQLNQFITVVSDVLTLHDSATIESRPATTFEEMLSRITDAGKAEDQRFMPQVSSGNVQSIQSAVPLSSTAGASTADITVASHTLQYGFGAIGYNSGSIIGLTPNTLYHIYADDPDYAGGAVSYLATTNPQTISAANGRYRVGSITTDFSTTAGNIIAATSANPIAFQTSAPHGWSTSNTVQFAGLPDDFGTNLNGLQKVITVTGLDTFTVAVDGAAYIAYTSGGTATRVSSGTTGGGGGGGGGPSGVIP